MAVSKLLDAGLVKAILLSVGHIRCLGTMAAVKKEEAVPCNCFMHKPTSAAKQGQLGHKKGDSLGCLGPGSQAKT